MTSQPGGNKNLKVATIVASIAVGMVGVAYAAVPLYDLFCRVTGFGGTTQRSAAAPDTVLDRKITIAFDANVNAALGWEFKPVQRHQTVRIGEQSLAFYHARNTGNAPVTGTATFNVSPPQAGQYFSKIQCFCFTEQLLEPGQSVDMPVTYYVDPEIANDPDLKNLETITLSYTFYKADKDPVQTSSVSGGANKDTVN